MANRLIEKIVLQNYTITKIYVYLQHHENLKLVLKVMDDKRIIVGKNLKLFRDSADYKQQEVSDILGIDRGAYANYESGSREMPFKLLQKVCEIYGIGLSDLFEEDVARVEKDMIFAFRKNKLSVGDQKEVHYFKSIVRNYLKMSKLAQDEV